jgi:hypothetical protein
MITVLPSRPPSCSSTRFPNVCPGALLVSFTDVVNHAGDFHRITAYKTAHHEQLLGKKYCEHWGIDGIDPAVNPEWAKVYPHHDHKRWTPGYVKATVELTIHGKFVLGPGPFGGLFRDFSRAMATAREEVHHYFSDCARVAPTIFREFMVGCALVATHVGGGPLVKTIAAKTDKSFYRGKFHPPIEYKVLQLRASDDDRRPADHKA